MWLVNTTTLKLEEILDSKHSQYAILSHRWRKEELSFQDITTGRGQNKQGYAKLKSFCRIACREGLKYAWIDTCCINKESSSELSEAINSMYRWYADAAVCIAHLDDVPPPATVNSRSGELGSDQVDSFCKSVWFRRGWTLQELLAPSEVEFYDNEWAKLGSKTPGPLMSVIVKASGIPEEALTGKQLASFSVAQRMSWAAKRETTRLEDQAYSLMGIFNVNMSPLYGEGGKAFIRLQREILHNCNDHSIFAWSSPTLRFRGLLASKPCYFKSSGNVISYQDMTELSDGLQSISFGNGALSTSFLMSRVLHSSDIFLALLKCRIGHQRVGILLTYTNLPATHRFARITNRHFPTISGTDQLDADKIELLDDLQLWRINVLQSEIMSTLSIEKRYGFTLYDKPWSVDCDDVVRDVIPSHIVDPDSSQVSYYTRPGESGSIFGLLPLYEWQVPIILFGLDSHMQPVCMVLTHRCWARCTQNDLALSLLGLKRRQKWYAPSLLRNTLWSRLHRIAEAWNHWPPYMWALDDLPPATPAGWVRVGSYLLTRESDDEKDARWYIRAAPRAKLVAHDLSVTVSDVYPGLEVCLPDLGIMLKLEHGFGTLEPEAKWKVGVGSINKEYRERCSPVVDYWTVRETSGWLTDQGNPPRRYKSLQVIPPIEFGPKAVLEAGQRQNTSVASIASS